MVRNPNRTKKKCLISHLLV